MKRVSVLGDGAWGTAIASVLADNGHEVALWCQDREAYDSIKNYRVNEKYLPGFTLHERIQPTMDLKHALEHSAFIFEAIPVKYMRTVLTQAQPFYTPEQCWVILSKGVEYETLLLPSGIIDDVFKDSVHKVVIAGPSYAHDVMHKEQTAVDCAGDVQDVRAVQALMNNAYFHTYATTDLMGVQVGGAFKNVIALAIGMLDGAQYGDNARSFVLTRGFQEITKIAPLFGGKQETLFGLSGFGDLVLTALGKYSKNRTLGKQLGAKEISFAALQHKEGALPEGINTLHAVIKLTQQHSIELPLCTALYKVVYENQPIEIIFAALHA